MPKPPIPLTNDDLKAIIETKSGIFLQSETESFTVPDTHPNKKDVPPPTTLATLKKNFKELTNSSTFDENLNSGLYIRLTDLRKCLDEFEAEKDNKGRGLTHLHIGFGLRKAKKDLEGNDIDWNCIHLIMQGAIPVPEFESESIIAQKPIGKKPERVSKNQYSTYDGDESNYVGAKPGTPPFGPEE
jgi:hypothetical protein